MSTKAAEIPVLHEEISDEVAMVDYKKTLFSSTIKAGKSPMRSVYSAPADKPPQGRLGGKSETRTIDRSKVSDRHKFRKEIKGVVQEKVEDYGVTDRAEEIDGESAAGIDDLVGDAYVKTLEAYKQGLEMTGLSQQVQDDAAQVMNEKGNIETQHLTGGASWWADASPLGDADLVPHADFRAPAALNVEVTTDLATDVNEKTVKAFIQAKAEAMNNDADSLVFCTYDFQSHFDGFLDEAAVEDGFVHIRSFNFEGGKGMYEFGIKKYRTSFGMCTLRPTQHLNAHRNFGAVDEDGLPRALTASTTNTDATVTVNSTRGLQPFMRIKGAGIPANAYIVEVTNSTTIEISAAATATATGVTLTTGRLDHALFLEMKHFEKRVGRKGIRDVDLTPDQSGKQGYVQGFISYFCALPAVQGKFWQK
jgi:hypothetical protein